MEYLAAVGVFVLVEIFALPVFALVNRLGPSPLPAWSATTIVRGVIERLVLFTALLHNFPQMLIAFAALKLGARLRHEEGTDISNTYFIVGNLLSVFIALATTIITRRLVAAFSV